jgi:hypothetical protein
MDRAEDAVVVVLLSGCGVYRRTRLTLQASRAVTVVDSTRFLCESSAKR